MKKVYEAMDPADAHLLRGLLESADIEATVRGEYLWGVRGDVPVPPAASPTVWILNDADYERAMELVSAYCPEDHSWKFADEAWACEKCGESNGEQFTECWNCGASRKRA